MIYSIKAKVLQNDICGHNVYMCTLLHAYEWYKCEHGVHMYAVGFVHEHVEFISCETKIPTYYD